MVLRRWLVVSAAIVSYVVTPDARAAGHYFKVSYPPSQNTNELQIGVRHTLWIPDGATRLRGLIVHQHGCGAGACKGGETAAYDLHWQALAKKWDCALFGPSYQQEEKQNCRLWCDPRNGSEKAFMRAIRDLARDSCHAELEMAPWCLWGHSGGGFWASLMQTMHPDRIVAIWCRSGTALGAWERGEVPRPEITAEALAIPTMCNPGEKEKGHARFDGAWTGLMAMFQQYRAKGAPIGFAPDPNTAHECGDSRYLAIPFFDACLALRLPATVGEPLRSVDMKGTWLGDLSSHQASPAGDYSGDPRTAVWLPDARVAKAWTEYIITGEVADATPPNAPTSLRIERKPDGAKLRWDAEADLESGIQAFLIYRDGTEIGRVPEKLEARFGKPIFQTMSYHDTPEPPLPEMSFEDKGGSGGNHEYAVVTVNAAGLKSQKSGAVRSGE